MPALLVMLVLGGGAVAGLVWTSLRPGALVGGTIGVDAWRSVVADPGFHRALGFTLWVTAASTVLAVALAWLIILAGRHRPAVRVLATLPVPVPHLVVAVLAVTWLAPGGLADRVLGTLPVEVVGDRLGIGIILTYAYKEAPFLALLGLTAWDGATVRLDEAASTLGASRVQRWRDVVLPRLLPPLALGGALVSAYVVGATEVPLVVGASTRETLSTYALHLTALEGPVARAEAAVVLTIAAVMVLVVAVVPAWLLSRRSAWW